MNNSEDKYFEVDKLISKVDEPDEDLETLFSKRLNELDISQNNALELLGLQYRTLHGILKGELKQVDVMALVNIGTFLQISTEDVVRLYIKAIQDRIPELTPIASEKIKFIKENFDLASLKRIGFIESLTDFKHIEERITSFLGLKSILEYGKDTIYAAFSAGKIIPKNTNNRTLWMEAARTAFLEIDNPNIYDREGLVSYFPEIRWHSMNVELGLLNVISKLYKMGITVIYQTRLPGAHVRGACFSISSKPCIVLTDYKGFYPTLWFSLIHELFHLLFDWEEIKQNRFHLSLDGEENIAIAEKEKEANEFAREYLFSAEKTKIARTFSFSRKRIHQFSIDNHVHPSFFYVFNAYDSQNVSDWKRAQNYNPDIKSAIRYFDNPWNISESEPVHKFIKNLKTKVYTD
ncbi:MAG: ImmA/IrrE family metallo-endopeptidase [Bacteroidota bacterium]